MSYIEREAFLDAIERGKKYQQDADDIAEMLQNFPAADVRPAVRGKWVNDHNGKYSPAGDNYFCSACKDPSLRAFGKPARTNFCPNCGADMREEHDNG